MAKEGTISWRGASGRLYKFDIYPKATPFIHVEGNYIFAKRSVLGWDAVYIGEGYLDERTSDQDHLACASRKGFTHFHTHINENEEKRKLEETDLIAGNDECLEENGGCNKTSDG